MLHGLLHAPLRALPADALSSALVALLGALLVVEGALFHAWSRAVAHRVPGVHPREAWGCLLRPRAPHARALLLTAEGAAYAARADRLGRAMCVGLGVLALVVLLGAAA